MKLYLPVEYWNSLNVSFNSERNSFPSRCTFYYIFFCFCVVKKGNEQTSYFNFSNSSMFTQYKSFINWNASNLCWNCVGSREPFKNHYTKSKFTMRLNERMFAINSCQIKPKMSNESLMHVFSNVSDAKPK